MPAPELPSIYSGAAPMPELPSIYSGATPTPELPSIYDTGRAPAPVPEIPSIYSGEGAMPQLPDIYTTGAADAAAANLARSMTNTPDFALPDTSGYQPQLPDIYTGQTTEPKLPDIYSQGTASMPELPDIYAKGATSPGQTYADLMGARTGVDVPVAEKSPAQTYADLIGERTGVEAPSVETSPAQSYADLIKSRLADTQGAGAGQGYADEMQRRIDESVGTSAGEELAREAQQRLESQQRAEAGQNLADEAQRRLEARQPDQPQATSIQEALNQQYMNRIGGGEDPILASQLADLRKRQQDEEAATIEQLSRYGVLRGGGDTASALMEMREGQSRNRLALEAAAAQRQQQDLRDALGFDQARSQQGLAGRGMTLQERINAEDVANQQLNRQLQRAGVTGQFMGADTLQAQEQADRMLTSEAQRSSDRRRRATC
jgi:hypothetical protein